MVRVVVGFWTSLVHHIDNKNNTSTTVYISNVCKS